MHHQLDGKLFQTLYNRSLFSVIKILGKIPSLYINFGMGLHINNYSVQLNNN